jgi:plastocyanin
MRLRMTMLATIVALGLTAGLAAAQQPVPTVNVNASPTGVTVDAAVPIPAGPTRMNFVRPAGNKKDLSAYVVLLVPGVSAEQLLSTLASEDRNEGEASLGLVSIQASVSLSASEAQRAVTFTVKPGLSYLVVVEQDTDTGPTPRSSTTFTSSGAANGATAAAPAATYNMQGLRFRGPSTLKQTSTVRFQNRDGVAHFALAFPLRKGTTTAQFGKAVKSESQRAFGRIAAGAPYMAQNVISGGDTTNDPERHFPKKGSYGLVCFIDGHERLGMYKIITVR